MSRLHRALVGGVGALLSLLMASALAALPVMPERTPRQAPAPLEVPDHTKPHTPSRAPILPAQNAPLVRAEIAVGLELVQELAEEGRTDEAFARLTELLGGDDLTPTEDAVLRKQLAFFQMARQDYAGAIRSLEAVLSVSGFTSADRRDTEYRLAELYALIGVEARAIDILEAWFEKVRRPPAAASFLLAKLYVLNDRPAEALALVETGLQRGGDLTDGDYQLAAALFREFDRSEPLIDVLRILVDRNPSNAALWEQLWEAYLRDGQEGRALVIRQIMFERGLLPEPDQWRDLANQLIEVGAPERAAVILERASPPVERDVASLLLLAEAYEASRDFARARVFLEDALARMPEGQPGEPGARLGLLLVRMRVYPAAIGHLERALGLREDPNQALMPRSSPTQGPALGGTGALWLALGEARAMTGELEAARAAFATARADTLYEEQADGWLAYLDALIASN